MFLDFGCNCVTICLVVKRTLGHKKVYSLLRMLSLNSTDLSYLVLFLAHDAALFKDPLYYIGTYYIGIHLCVYYFVYDLGIWLLSICLSSWFEFQQCNLKYLEAYQRSLPFLFQIKDSFEVSLTFTPWKRKFGVEIKVFLLVSLIFSSRDVWL